MNSKALKEFCKAHCKIDFAGDEHKEFCKKYCTMNKLDKWLQKNDYEIVKVDKMKDM